MDGGGGEGHQARCELLKHILTETLTTATSFLYYMNRRWTTSTNVEYIHTLYILYYPL